jgi:hypothetical protein
MNPQSIAHRFSGEIFRCENPDSVTIHINNNTYITYMLLIIHMFSMELYLPKFGI